MMKNDWPLKGALSIGVAATTPGVASMRVTSSLATSRIRSGVASALCGPVKESIDRCSG